MSKGNEEVINIHQSDSQEYRGEDKDWDSYFDELEDSEFKKFYINNTKEKKYLRKKVDGIDLKSFASRKFLLEDIWKCLYIKEYLNKFNIESEVFRREVINYRKNNYSNKSDEYKFEKNLLKYTEDYISANTKKGEKAFHEFESFKRVKLKDLTIVFKYAFNDPDIMEKFKDGRHRIFDSVEAMFIFFILDDKYKKEVKHIQWNEEHLIKRRYMNGLKRYAIAIDNKRNLLQGSVTNSITDIYDKRVELLRSDLRTVCNLINDALCEYAKGDEADIEKVIEISKKSIKKLKRFVKRNDKSTQSIEKVEQSKANN